VPDARVTIATRGQVAYRRLGDGEPVLVLHGFPDHGLGMLRLAEAIAAAGAEAIVPALPGYYPSDPVPDEDYSVAAVSGDMLAVADALGHERLAIVGHDWGGLLAYHLGASHPERVRAIVSLSVPHPTGFRLRRRVVREQQTAAYAWILAYADDAPEIAADPAWLTQLAHVWSPGLLRDDWPEVLAVLTRPEVARAVHRWYRCDFDGLGAPTGDVLVPATVIHGSQDGCIGPAVYEGTETHFRAGVTRRTLPAVGHWPHLEAPDETTDIVLAALGLAGASAPAG
jgi:pimeloyl-ACP methyl ester carboxylesterase